MEGGHSSGLLGMVGGGPRIRAVVYDFLLTLTFLRSSISDSLSWTFRCSGLKRSFVSYLFGLRVMLRGAAANWTRRAVRTCFRTFHVLISPLLSFGFQCVLR